MLGRLMLPISAVAFGAVVSVLTSYLIERTVTATYPDIDGCVVSCEVVATGWPIVFITDYPGMTMAGLATLDEVIFAADRFSLAMFALDVAFWAGVFMAGAALVQWLRRPDAR